MVDPLQLLFAAKYCLDGAPLFWNCTAWLVTLPVAAATGLDVFCTLGSSFANAGFTERRPIRR